MSYQDDIARNEAERARVDEMIARRNRRDALHGAMEKVVRESIRSHSEPVFFPTMQLRLVKSTTPAALSGADIWLPPVLQQAFNDQYGNVEWLDVPIVEEWS